MSEEIGRKYGLLTSLSLVVGICIGIGIFFRTSQLLIITEGQVKVALWAWVAGGVLALLGALCLSELSGTVKESGGDISYAAATVGRPYAFIMGWGSILVVNPSLNAILAWIGSSYVCQLFYLNVAIYQLPLAIFLMVSAFTINIIKPIFAGRLQSILTIVKLFPLLAIAIFGLFMVPASPDVGINQVVPTISQLNTVAIFFAALIPIVFSFDGWSMVATLSGEIKNVDKNLPLALTGGIIFVTIIYIAVYLGFINVFPVKKLVEPDVVPFGIAQALFGSKGARIIMAGIVISALGALNGFVMGTMRRAYGLAIKGLFPFSDIFKKVHPTCDVPLASSLLMLCLTFVYIMLNYYGTDFSAIGSVLTMLLYIAIYIGLIKMRYSGMLNKNGYHTPFFPLIPVLAVIGWTMVAIGIFLIDRVTTINVLIAIVLYLTGVPVYVVMQKKSKKVV